MKKWLKAIANYLMFPWEYWYYEYQYWKRQRKMKKQDPFIYENYDDEKR